MSDGSLSPSSKDSAIDIYENGPKMSEEIDYLVNHRAAQLVQKSYEQDRYEFEKLMLNLSNVNCMQAVEKSFNEKLNEIKLSIQTEYDDRSRAEMDRLNDQINILSKENNHLKAQVDETKVREIALMGLIPNQELLHRYRATIDQMSEKHSTLDNKVTQLQLSNHQLAVAYNQCESRCRVVTEDLNEESRKREFAERRSNELYKLLQRAEVGIGIDRRSKPP